MRWMIVCIFLLLPSFSLAKEIAGVAVQESVYTDSGATLFLNGAGIRSKFFMDIYLAQLYLEEQAGSAEEVLAGGGVKKMIMHILYKEIPKDKLVEGWLDGFAANNSDESLRLLQSRIDQFNSMFVAVTKGQRIVFTYLPGQGTEVKIAGDKKGIVPGKDFNDALLSIWLGEKPVTGKLKEKLLGAK